MTCENIFIIGAGGHGKVAIATLIACGRTPTGIFDDNPARIGEVILGVPVLGGTGDLLPDFTGELVLGIGDNLSREAVAKRFPNARWATVIHPTAVVHESVTLGSGTVVFAGTVIQPDTTIGSHVIINTGATVDHDCHIGSFAHLAPGTHLAGGVTIEDGVFLGIGGVVTPYAKIGAWTIVGAGATVLQDLASGGIAYGTPARIRP